MMGFTNLAKTISSNDNDEVWAELQNYRDNKHLEGVAEKMENDKNAMAIGQQFMSLIAPSSMCTFGGFNRLWIHYNVVDNVVSRTSYSFSL